METKLPKGTGGFLHPEEVLKELEIKEGMKIADFGCGHGYFSVPLAKSVGQKGQVFALDVLKSALEGVESKAKIEGVSNIKTIWSNLEIEGASKLEDKSVDLVLLANILFQSQKKSEIITEAKRVLKNDGRIVIIEWMPQSFLAPREGWLITEEEAENLAESQGFKLEKKFATGSHHYGLVFNK